MMNKPTAIIFDFDDTLIDSKPVIEKALEATFLEFNIPQDIITVKNIDRNQSLRNYFEQIFADKIAEARKAYYKYYDLYSVNLKALDGAEAVLKLLKLADVFTAIVSNKGGSRLRDEVHNKFLWTDYFQAIIGSGDAEQDKPSSLPAKLALQNAKLDNFQDVWLMCRRLIIWDVRLFYLEIILNAICQLII